MSTKYQQIFIYFVPTTSFLLDVRAMTMENKDMSYIEGVLVEIYKDDVLVATGLTNTNGTYKTYLAAGTYRIELSKEGYWPVTKNETLTRNTELMVNCPTKMPISGQSGIIRLFMADHIGNPQMTTVYTISLINAKKTASITTIHQITVA